MPLGNAINTISYNGHTFDERTETVGVNARYKYDQSGRTIAYTVYAITLQTIIGGDVTKTTSDVAMLAVRNKLSVPGRPFRYQNTGFGDLTVNVSDTSKDVVWGPKPQELSCKPFGVNAWEIVWKVEVAIPQCANAAFTAALMEFNYRLAIDQDRQGFTTRTYRGYYIIPQTRRSNSTETSSRVLVDSADNYWEKVIPELPENFRREVKDRELDETKCRCDFTVVDTEMGPNILPAGVTDCRASHSIESANRGLSQWIGTISADYEVAIDYPLEQVYRNFVLLCKQRFDNARANFKPFDNVPKANAVPDATKGADGFIIPTKFSFTEPDIFGRPLARFSLQYMMVQKFTNVLRASSVWMPVGNSWSVWKTSLEKMALHPRGNAKMKYDPKDDVVIDLCLDRGGVVIGTQQEEPRTRRDLRTTDFADDCPSPADSWIFYDIQLQSESNDPVFVHKPLPTFRLQTTYQFTGTVQNGKTIEVTTPIIDVPSDIVQRVTSNSDVVYVTGAALRACYNIDPPVLQSIGGKPAVFANRGDEKEYYQTGILGNYGYPIIWAKWRHRYIIPSKRNIINLTSLRPLSTPSMRVERLSGTRRDQEVQMGTNDTDRLRR